MQFFLPLIFALQRSSRALSIQIFALEIKQQYFSFSVIGKFDLNPGQTTDGGNFPSLSSSEEGYHMDTPPTVSLVSDIQPCAIEIEVRSEPVSLTSNEEKMVLSETKSLSTASSDAPSGASGGGGRSSVGLPKLSSSSP